MKKWKQFPSIVAKRRNAKAPDRYCRQDISVAEMPRSRRATAQSERMVRDPKVADYFHTMNAYEWFTHINNKVKH
jgi:hypothetical protein